MIAKSKAACKQAAKVKEELLFKGFDALFV